MEPEMRLEDLSDSYGVSDSVSNESLKSVESFGSGSDI